MYTVKISSYLQTHNWCLWTSTQGPHGGRVVGTLALEQVWSLVCSVYVQSTKIYHSVRPVVLWPVYRSPLPDEIMALAPARPVTLNRAEQRRWMNDCSPRPSATHTLYIVHTRCPYIELKDKYFPSLDIKTKSFLPFLTKGNTVKRQTPCLGTGPPVVEWALT